MYSIRAKLAYDEWHKHAEQYNKLIEAGFVIAANTTGDTCRKCFQAKPVLYQHHLAKYCHRCAVMEAQL